MKVPAFKSRLGSLSYLIGGIKVGVRNIHWTARVLVDGKDIAKPLTQRVLMLTVGNSTFDGGGLATTPGAKVDDAQLHVMMATPIKLRSKIWFALMLVARQHHRLSSGVIASGKTAEINGENLAWNDDGEPVGTFDRREFRVLPGAVRIIR